MGTLLSFLFFTALVGLITYWRTRSEKLSSRKGYFLAGRSLSGWVIAGSLMLTNLSAANFTGMTAQVYGGTMAPIAWTVTVIPPLVFFAGIILPLFLRKGYATIPEFLENRFGQSTRRIVTGLFLFSYIFGGMPVALYGGAIAIIHLFDVPTLLNMDEQACVWVVVWSLGIIGGIYALFGGLKGVAISDTLNGVGLLVGGLLVLLFGIAAVGNGSFVSGVDTILTEDTQKLNAIGGESDLVPFSVLFTGMLLHNLFFWCANQFIVQRCFGARSLKEGQKGVLIAGFFKILNVFYIAIPGVIAFHLYGSGHFDNNDWVYPTLVRDVMPPIFVGFFAAVIFGTVLSTYNSVLNSSVTLFAVDIYKPLWGREIDDAIIIRNSKRIGSLLVGVTLFIAPFIMRFEQGIFQYMVKTEILFGSPIFLVLLVGYFSKTVSAKAANTTLVSYLITLALFQHILTINLHFLHILALLFTLHCGLLFALSKVFPRRSAEKAPADSGDIDLRPWRWFPHVSLLAFIAMILTYVAFSPLGFVKEKLSLEIEYKYIIVGLTLAVCVLGLPALLRFRASKS
ncbi:MAG: solute:sodium symporter family transporter [Verrucomicrobiota bacterium]